MAHLQSRAMPQERDLGENGTTLSLCVKVGKAAVANPDLQIRGGEGGGCHADPEIGGGPVSKKKMGAPEPLPWIRHWLRCILLVLSFTLSLSLSLSWWSSLQHNHDRYL